MISIKFIIMLTALGGALLAFEVISLKKEVERLRRDRGEKN